MSQQDEAAFFVRSDRCALFTLEAFMKQKTVRVLIFSFLMIFILTGCSSEIIEEHINDPIALSGDLAYYAEMDENTLKGLCEEKHIEVTGTVSSAGYTLFYIGNTSSDNIRFSCTFSNHSDVLDNIKNGDIITVHGVCTDIIGDHVYLKGCRLSKKNESGNTITTEATAESTIIPSTESTTIPNTEPTTIPATEPPHTHNFSSATCTAPKTCSCGVTEGEAIGHSWKDATCTSPKICTICNERSGSAINHNYSNGKCTACGSTDPNYVSETMVWIPTHGGTKYHSKSSCSKMIDPIQVTKTEAINQGFEPCGRCY